MAGEVGGGPAATVGPAAPVRGAALAGPGSPAPLVAFRVLHPPEWEGWVPSDVIAVGDLVGPAPRLPSRALVLLFAGSRRPAALARASRRFARRLEPSGVRVLLVADGAHRVRRSGVLAVVEDPFGIGASRYGFGEEGGVVLVDGEGYLVARREDVQPFELRAIEEKALALAALDARWRHGGRGR